VSNVGSFNLFSFFVVVASSDQYKKLIEKIEGVLISLVVLFMIERTLRYCTVVGEK